MVLSCIDTKEVILYDWRDTGAGQGPASTRYTWLELDFFVLVELDSDQTLLGLSSE